MSIILHTPSKTGKDTFDQITKMVIDLLIMSLLRHKDALLRSPALLFESRDVLAQIADEAIALVDFREHLSTAGLASTESRELMARVTASYVNMVWQWF